MLKSKIKASLNGSGKRCYGGITKSFGIGDSHSNEKYKISRVMMDVGAGERQRMERKFHFVSLYNVHSTHILYKRQSITQQIKNLLKPIQRYIRCKTGTENSPKHQWQIWWKPICVSIKIDNLHTVHGWVHVSISSFLSMLQTINGQWQKNKIYFYRKSVYICTCQLS